MPDSLPWFKEGLRFKCTQCGQCCTGSPGFVWVNEEEISAMALFLGITVQDFVKTYTRRVGNRLSLLEHNRTYDCVFLKEGKCSVYGARPKQCKTFPWWKENVSSETAWRETAERCEGIDHPDAPIISLEEIEKSLD